MLAWGGSGLVASLLGALGWHWARRTEVAIFPVAKPAETAPRETSYSPREQSRPAAATGPMSQSSFAPYVGNTFQLEIAGAGLITARLVEVTAESTQKTPKGTFASFSILFEAPKTLFSEGGLFRVSHPIRGVIDLYLSPVGRSDKHTFMQGVLSQRV